jgi:hypothetical protein
MTSDLKVIVGGEELQMNEFVANVIHDVVLAILNNLRDIHLDEISKIEVS